MKMDWYRDSDEENHKYNSDRATWPPFSIRESTFFFKFRLRTPPPPNKKASLNEGSFTIYMGKPVGSRFR